MIDYKNKSVDSSGLNNFSKHGRNTIGEEFDDLCNAVMKLCNIL